jgi:hypothetical protein
MADEVMTNFQRGEKVSDYSTITPARFVPGAHNFGPHIFQAAVTAL